MEKIDKFMVTDFCAETRCIPVEIIEDKVKFEAFVVSDRRQQLLNIHYDWTLETWFEVATVKEN